MGDIGPKEQAIPKKRVKRIETVEGSGRTKGHSTYPKNFIFVLA